MKRCDNMRYIHYGHNKFDISKFEQIKNQPFSSKPSGGFWASRVDDEKGWKNWVENSEFSFGKFDISFEFTLNPDAKVLVIDNLEMVDKLPKAIQPIPLNLSISHQYIDFEELSKEYDAIELLISDDFRLYYRFYGWDCNSILILNPNIVV